MDHRDNCWDNNQRNKSLKVQSPKSERITVTRYDPEAEGLAEKPSDTLNCNNYYLNLIRA